jgi:nitrite reductase (NADH) large subunit
VDFFDLASISMGVTKLRKPDPSYEFLTVSEPERSFYRRIGIKDGRLVGAVCIGVVDNAGVFGELIRRKIDVTDIKDVLLDEDFDYSKLLDLGMADYEDMFIRA